MVNQSSSSGGSGRFAGASKVNFACDYQFLVVLPVCLVAQHAHRIICPAVAVAPTKLVSPTDLESAVFLVQAPRTLCAF